MNQILIAASLALFSSSLVAAPGQDLAPVVCSSDLGHVMQMIPVGPSASEGVAGQPETFRIRVDAALSTPYVGPIGVDAEDNRLIVWSTEASTAETDTFANWDGNVGVKVTLPRGLAHRPLEQDINGTFKVELYVYNDDIEFDEARTILTCKLGN